MQIVVLRKMRGSGIFGVRILLFDVTGAGLYFVFRFTDMPETFFVTAANLAQNRLPCQQEFF